MDFSDLSDERRFYDKARFAVVIKQVGVSAKCDHFVIVVGG